MKKFNNIKDPFQWRTYQKTDTDSLDIVDELSANGLHEKSCYGLLAHVVVQW